jgi:hypothetical protein
LIVILLDELLQKGYGLGSGISLLYEHSHTLLLLNADTHVVLLPTSVNKSYGKLSAPRLSTPVVVRNLKAPSSLWSTFSSPGPTSNWLYAKPSSARVCQMS